MRAAEEILSKFSGKIIEPQVVGKVLLWDILGAQLHYNRTGRMMKLSMEDYIEKMAQRFDV